MSKTRTPEKHPNPIIQNIIDLYVKNGYEVRMHTDSGYTEIHKLTELFQDYRTVRVFIWFEDSETGEKFPNNMFKVKMVYNAIKADSFCYEVEDDCYTEDCFWEFYTDFCSDAIIELDKEHKEQKSALLQSIDLDFQKEEKQNLNSGNIRL